MSHSYCNLLYHILFSTQQRKRWLTDELRPRVHEYIGGAIRNTGGIAVAIIGGTEDHVHVGAKLRQDTSLADTLRDVKARTSGWLHRTFPQSQEFAWQTGYAAFTVSTSHLEKVCSYILSQEEHHRKTSFEDELMMLLRAHGIEYEEKYLLG